MEQTDSSTERDFKTGKYDFKEREKARGTWSGKFCYVQGDPK